MTKLVAESEAMVVINGSLRSELNKVPNTGKAKEEAMQVVEKHTKKKEGDREKAQKKVAI